MKEDSISQGKSVLIRDKEGYPRFPGTTADITYSPKISWDRAKIALTNLLTSDKELSDKILDYYLNGRVLS